MNCISESYKELCQQVLKFTNGNKLFFSSSEESTLIQEFSEEYRMMQKGTIKIGDNTYSAKLYYNGRLNNNQAQFHGKIIFQLPSISLLKGESLIIEVKGKK